MPFGLFMNIKHWTDFKSHSKNGERQIKRKDKKEQEKEKDEEGFMLTYSEVP